VAKSKKSAGRTNRKAASPNNVAASADTSKVTQSSDVAPSSASKAVGSKAVETSAAKSPVDAAKPDMPKTQAPKTEPKPAGSTAPEASKPAPTVKTEKPATPSKAAKEPAKNETPKEPAKKTPPPAKPVQSAPPPAQEKRRGGFIPLVLGGVIAGGIGYFAAQNNLFGAPDTTGQQITDNAARIDALENAEIPPVDLSAVDDLATQVQGVETQVQEVAAQTQEVAATLADIDARLTIVEERPAPDGGPSIADQTAFEKELQALKASAEEQRAEIAALLENAQGVEEATANAARAAQVQSAVSTINAAMGTGQPFADALAPLADSNIDVPAALSDVAEDGVTTMANLQSRFPDTARAALGVARSSGAVEGESGFGGFLKRQLGARSTQPREGSDPDAVLSRAEANVVDGDLDAALTELDTLPQDVQSAMQDWLEDARARNAAQIATQDLSQSQPAN